MNLDVEREFWDARAAERSAAEEQTSASAELDRYSLHLLQAVGDISGCDVLELGCGSGELTVALVDAGARVTALDASPGQVELTRRTVARWRPESDVRFLIAPAEETGMPAASFDVIVGKWVLHHLDIPHAVPEIARLLRPDGRAVFYENHGRNPLLAVSRSRLAGRCGIVREGTATEHPLTRDEVKFLRAGFGQVQLRYPEFLLFALASSRVLGYHGYRWFEALDGLIWRWLPGLRPLSWHVVLICTRPRP